LSSRSASARGRNPCAASDANQASSMGASSCHAVPAAASISWFSLTKSLDSQYPCSLSVVCGIKLPGSAAPSRLIARVSADVPLRCIPSTTTARRLLRRWDSKVATMLLCHLGKSADPSRIARCSRITVRHSNATRQCRDEEGYGGSGSPATVTLVSVDIGRIGHDPTHHFLGRDDTLYRQITTCVFREN